uniref:Uncharacterized protein n=1 Tax=Cucumis melo TaxID=3656 RepID=A0A9I9E377_CUCME
PSISVSFSASHNGRSAAARRRSTKQPAAFLVRRPRLAAAIVCRGKTDHRGCRFHQPDPNPFPVRA